MDVSRQHLKHSPIAMGLPADASSNEKEMEEAIPTPQMQQQDLLDKKGTSSGTARHILSLTAQDLKQKPCSYQPQAWGH